MRAIRTEAQLTSFRTHDYSGPNRCWGHDYVFDPIDPQGIRARMMGWGHGIENGDYLIIKNGYGTTRYRVISVEYMRDPQDMWKALVKFDPR
jgi:hypothetical protein